MHAQYILERKLLLTLNVPSEKQCSDSDKKRMPICETKMNILSESLLPLPNIKNGSPDLVTWYSFGSAKISSRFNGICGMLSSFRAFQMFGLTVVI